MALARICGTQSVWIRSCVLLLLAEEASHGYEMLQSLEQLGAPGVDSGTLYRVLRSLEREELTWSVWEPAGQGPSRRVYELTSKGRLEFETMLAELRSAAANIDHYVARGERALTLDVGTEI